VGVKVRKRGKKWYVVIDYHGRRKSKCVGTKKAAEEVKCKIEARLALGDMGIFAEGKKTETFQAYAERWLRTDALCRCKPSTVDFYHDYLKCYVWPRFGSLEITRVSRDAVKDFIADLSRKGLAKNTIRLVIASMRVVLSAAVEDGNLPSNPAAKVGKFVKTDKPEHRATALEPEEVERFLAAAQDYCPEYYPLFLIAVRAGLRQGEILGLKWGDFQFGQGEDDPNRFISVERRWYRGRFSTPKGKKERRVDMSRELRKVLIGLRDQRLLECYQQGRTSIVDDLVFPGEGGNPLPARKLVESYFLPVLERAGLRRFRFHDLRHTFGSLLIEAGAPLPDVRDQMGHSSIQMTADKYVHLVPRRNVHFIDRLDSVTSPQQSATQAQPKTEGVSRVPVSTWCERGDSNPHPLRDQILSLARLPIPPLSRRTIIRQDALIAPASSQHSGPEGGTKETDLDALSSRHDPRGHGDFRDRVRPALSASSFAVFLGRSGLLHPRSS
jgi:integrase